jgi:hypothetical protein
MSDQLQISKDRVLKAAAGCPTVKNVLEVLFPEAFENNKEIIPVITANVNHQLPENLQMASDVAVHDSVGIKNEPSWLVSVENDGIFLSPWYNWALSGNKLIPSRPINQ